MLRVFVGQHEEAPRRLRAEAIGQFGIAWDESLQILADQLDLGAQGDGGAAQAAPLLRPLRSVAATWPITQTSTADPSRLSGWPAIQPSRIQMEPAGPNGLIRDP